MPSEPLPIIDSVDLPRFMGDWYVIASIPTFLEKDIYNGVESYQMNEDGSIATTFTFRKGGFDGPEKSFTPTAFVREHPSNAEWGMQFVWPFKAEYLIIWLDDEYTQTVIGRTARDYVWIMAREPQLSDEDYEEILAYLDKVGYDLTKLRKVPQRWP